MINLEEIDEVANWLYKESKLNSGKTDQAIFMSAMKRLHGSAEIKQLGYQTFVGRKKIAQILPVLSKGFFTSAGLEQRTHPLISKYHASKFTGCSTVLEICTGLGFDTIHLASTCKKIVSIESDPIHFEFAKKNLEICGIQNVDIVLSDAETLLPKLNFDEFDGIFADPSRRIGSSRIKDAESYLPSLSLLTELKLSRNDYPFVIKVGPTLRDTIDGFSSEWIGFDSECKERLLVKNIPETVKICIINPQVLQIEFSSLKTDEEYEENEFFCKEFPQSGYLYFAHPALLASGCVDKFILKNNLMQVSQGTRVLYSQENRSFLPFLDRFEILKVSPFDKKKLKQELFKLKWNNRTELKKRNFPIEPESLRKFLDLPSAQDTTSDYGVVIFLLYGKKQLMIFAKRVL